MPGRSMLIGVFLGMTMAPVIAWSQDQNPSPGLDRLRAALTRAADLLRTADKDLPRQFRAPTEEQREQFKSNITVYQQEAALIQYELSACLEELGALTEERNRAPRRWQSLFDLTLARLRIRTAALEEYNYHLGQLRRELPSCAAPRHHGWRLVVGSKIECREAARLLREARQALDHLATDQAGTPWELLARRELLVLATVPLQWEPVNEP